MNSEPAQAPEEAPEAPDEPNQPATKHFVRGNLRLLEIRLKDELKPLSRDLVNSMIENAIRSLKSDLERTQLDKERETFRKKTDRDLEWIVRIVSCVVVAMLTLIFAGVVSQCTGNITELKDRINTLESKESKKAP
jgi:hypothetical protein